ADDVAKVLFVGEARNDIVRLRFEIDAHQTPLRRGIEEREAGARHEIVHEGRDEGGLAGPGEARGAKPDGWRYKVRGEVAEAAKSVAEAFGVGGKRHEGLLARRPRARKGLRMTESGQNGRRLAPIGRCKVAP